jgi:hypothetical protein
MIDFNKIFFRIPAVVFHSSIVASQSLVRHTIAQHFRPLVLATILSAAFFNSPAQVTIKFNAVANGKKLVLNDSSYTNAFNESYQVSRLKYYISNIALHAYDGVFFYDIPTLMEAGGADSIIIPLQPGNYYSIEFSLGVDSGLNCSGAQAGALDPLNGMFWTWNSGYIFFKLEGYSSASTADLQRIEQHVGGYRYPNNASRKITLKIPGPLKVEKNSRHTISINLNLDNYWKGKNDIKIADQALLMTPGGLAIKAAGNFEGMFSINGIQ